MMSKDLRIVWGATDAIWQALIGGDRIRSLTIKGVGDPSLDDPGDGVAFLTVN
jgi:hypothetical protein